MEILSCITLENGVDMTFTVKKNMLWFEMDEPTDKEMMVTIYGCGIRSVVEDNHAYSEGLRRSPEEYEVPSDTYTIIGQKTEGKETTYHHSELDKKRLSPGTYIFTFSNDQYIKLTVVFNHNKLSFEEN
uniref:Uncharacterized protein n=1 Tax=viral metagenome TaxID=1070528 RepID=A0A6C0HTT4_9ZZZZ